MTVTGDRVGAGTSANVFITLFGKTGITRKILLKTDSKNLFQRGVSDTFKVKADCVGPMKKIRIEHDNTGVGPGWYLERVRCEKDEDIIHHMLHIAHHTLT